MTTAPPDGPPDRAPTSALRYLDDPADLDRYLDLREELDRLDAELDALAPTILQALEMEDDGRASARGYTLEACVRRTYGYSDAVTEAEVYVRECRAAERASGAAAVEAATGYVRVTRDPAAAADHARALGAEAVTAALAAVE